MSVIILLIIISVVVAVFFLGIFIWAVNSGQYDDTYSPSVRMLFDDKKPASPSGERTGRPAYRTGRESKSDKDEPEPDKEKK